MATRARKKSTKVGATASEAVATDTTTELDDAPGLVVRPVPDAVAEAATTARRDASSDRPPARVDVAPPAFRAVASLDVGGGVFVLLTSPAGKDELKQVGFGSGMVGAISGQVTKCMTDSGVVVYAAYIASDTPRIGLIEIHCCSDAGHHIDLSVNSFSHVVLKHDMLQLLIRRFGQVLLPSMEAHLPRQHELWQRISTEKNIGFRSVVPAESSSAPVLRGCLDGVIDGIAHGWVHDSSRSDAHLAIEIVSGDRVIGKGVANLHRQDLADAGIGKGDHHFQVRISYELLDGAEHDICLRVVENGFVIPDGIQSAVMSENIPKHFDWLSRDETMRLAQDLANQVNVVNYKARQVLLGLFMRGSVAQETGELEDARKMYRKIIDVVGENVLCHLKMAETWLLGKDLEQALISYRTAMRMSPEAAWAQLGLANVLQLQGFYKEAENLYISLLEKQPEMPECLYRLERLRSSLQETMESLLHEAACVAFEKTVIFSS